MAPSIEGAAAKKILIIDDHSETLRLIEMTMRREGYTVLVAMTGPEGLKVAEAEEPDLILLDIMMPGMDGIEVCRRIRAHPYLARTPIIMFTAKGQPQDKREGLGVGADDYLAKPAQPVELKRRVAAILNRERGPVIAAEIPQPVPAAPAPRDPERMPIPRDSDESPLIVFMGTRGGSGATLAALNVAHALAEAGPETILVDLDLAQGHVALYLDLDVTADVADWLILPEDERASLPALRQYMMPVAERLTLLPARPRLEPPHCPTQDEVGALAAALRQTRQAVVVDAGRCDTESIAPLLGQATQIVLCFRPERTSVIRGRALYKHLRQEFTDAGRINALMFDFGNSAALSPGAVEGLLGFSLLDVVNVEIAQVAQTVNRGKTFVQLAPEDPVTEQFRQIGRALVGA